MVNLKITETGIEEVLPQKTIYPVVNSTLVQFNLPLQPNDIRNFRQALLECIPAPADREIISNERWEGDTKTKLVRYPQVQFRLRNGNAAVWAMQQGVTVINRFIQHYKNNFGPYNKTDTNDTAVKIIKPTVQQPAPVYHLFYYLPFNVNKDDDNYNWYKNSRNLSDIEKTKKLESLLTAHLCSFIHYSGGFIPRQKIKLAILDKKMLTGVNFKNREYPAYEIRYTVNLKLPPHIGLGNKCSHGFGWQITEE